MLRLIGIICSCIVTGHSFFETMETLYEKKYVNARNIYLGAYILYIILSTGIAWLEIPILNVAASMFALCVLSKVLYKAQRKNILINSGFMIIYLAIVDIVVTVTLSAFLQSSTYSILINSKYFFLSGIGNSIIILCTYKLVIQILQRCQINVTSKLLHFYMIFLMFFEFGILCYFIKHEIEKENNILLLLISLGLVILDAGIIYLYKILSREADLKKRTELVEKQLEMTKKYYEGLQENYEQMQQIMHDSKKHIQVLCELNDIDKIKYGKELITSIAEIQPRFQCSDKIVCAIIWNKMQICEQKGIEFEVNMQDVSFGFMDKIEITALFANLLDNAVEACESSSNSKRRIELRVHSFKEYIVIKLRNTMGVLPKIKEGRLVSNKSGHAGLGMTILENLANKYYGNVDYEYSDQYFESKVILSVHNGIENIK